MDYPKRRWLKQTTALTLGASIGTTWSQTGGNIFVWSGFPPGGLGDQVSRPLMEQLRGRYPQNLIYDSKPGAAGRIAADHVKRSLSDGNNLLQGPASVLTLHPHVFRKLTYDPLRDFIPVAGLCHFTFVLTAGPGLPADINNLRDFVAWSKQNPQLANFGVPSTGSALHLTGMLLSKTAGIDLNVVPFKGGGPLLTALLGGQVPVSVNVVSEVAPHIKSRKLRALAVTSGNRWKSLPDVPTFQELGHKSINFTEWLGWFAPVGTPTSKIEALNQAVNTLLQGPFMGEIFARNALEPLGGNVQTLSSNLVKEHSYWAQVVKSTGFSPED